MKFYLNLHNKRNISNVSVKFAINVFNPQLICSYTKHNNVIVEVHFDNEQF